ncbi:MOSC domain-containing protein [Phytoactinopolyspora mesophila]|nr:MOSC N-terminal beta barrel domain-containing protein [Phytoactinopolyspora mesophila]
MQVARLGLTPVKGMAHVALPEVELTRGGPLHDRVFCVVEADTGRVLRTVENDIAMACEAVWTPPVLTIRAPGGDASGEVSEGALIAGQYWDRELKLNVIEGPWAGLLSRHFGRPVLLCRVAGPERAIWAGSVSLVTTSSLAEVARRTGCGHDDGARFRPTIVVDTGEAPAFVEDTWVGSRLRIGAAVVTVEERLPRCAVVDRRPAAGGHDVAVLRALAADRRDGNEIVFGVSGEVEQLARVALADPVRLLG